MQKRWYLFASVVRPNLEFGNAVWSPKLEKDKNLVESIQRRATRIIPGFKEQILWKKIRDCEASKPLLSTSVRWPHWSILVYSRYKKVPVGVLKCETRTNTRGHGHKQKISVVTHPCNNISCCFESPTCGTASLRDGITDAPSINAFKNRLDEAMQEHMFRLDMPSTLRALQ
jgi:hypothetical protein